MIEVFVYNNFDILMTIGLVVSFATFIIIDFKRNPYDKEED